MQNEKLEESDGYGVVNTMIASICFIFFVFLIIAAKKSFDKRMHVFHNIRFDNFENRKRPSKWKLLNIVNPTRSQKLKSYRLCYPAYKTEGGNLQTRMKLILFTIITKYVIISKL